MKLRLMFIALAFLLVEPLKVLYHPEPCPTPLPENATRQRCMEIRNIFLDESGNPKDLVDRQLEFNFFANSTFVGTVTENGWNAGNYYWIGTFDGIEYSYFTVMYVAGVFIMNAGMPAGIWEVKPTGCVSGYGNELYKVIELEPYNE